MPYLLFSYSFIMNRRAFRMVDFGTQKENYTLISQPGLGGFLPDSIPPLRSSEAMEKFFNVSKFVMPLKILWLSAIFLKI